jgi:hypothetical protein
MMLSRPTARVLEVQPGTSNLALARPIAPHRGDNGARGDKAPRRVVASILVGV